jgi:2-methylisocitrate lyase-like PEP mutase family enzyme
MSAGISIVSSDEAVTRYRAAVDAKNEIDKNFVIMAQCYARNAVNGGMAETLKRLRLYETDGCADWVQFEAPHSVNEIQRSRKVVKGPFSAMKGQLPRALTLAEHRELGLNAAWYTFLPDQVLKTAAWRFLESFKKKDMRAWYEFLDANPHTPFSGGAALPWDATGMSELTKLEARYFSKRKRRS